MSSFIALDVETANSFCDSICQIGLCYFDGSSTPRVWRSYVNPRDYFDPLNVGIHGITEDTVKDAPDFAGLHADLCQRLRGRIVVHHTAFDRTSIHQICEKYALDHLECTWLDSARVVRRTWKEYSQRGYGLSDVAQALGITFNHHDAGEDARAAGEILLRAVANSGRAVEDWPTELSRKIGYWRPKPETLVETNPDGALYGEHIVFTGALSISRRLAAESAAQAGCIVGTSVTRETTVLVVGEQDLQHLAGHTQSSKHRRALELIAGGQPLRIVAESDFLVMVKQV